MLRLRVFGHQPVTDVVLDVAVLAPCITGHLPAPVGVDPSIIASLQRFAGVLAVMELRVGYAAHNEEVA